MRKKKKTRYQDPPSRIPSKRESKHITKACARLLPPQAAACKAPLHKITVCQRSQWGERSRKRRCFFSPSSKWKRKVAECEKEVDENHLSLTLKSGWWTTNEADGEKLSLKKMYIVIQSKNMLLLQSFTRHLHLKTRTTRPWILRKKKKRRPRNPFSHKTRPSDSAKVENGFSFRLFLI